MKRPEKKLRSIGIGPTNFNFSILLAICWLSSAVNAQTIDSEIVGDWLVVDDWPYSIELGAPRTSPSLIIIEQRGIDLRFVKHDGSYSASPAGRNGPEFMYVPSEAEINLLLEPVYKKVAKGSFRIHRLDVSDSNLMQMAQDLSLAGDEAGQVSQENMLSACARYGSIASNEKLTNNWRWISTVLLSRCNLESGTQDSNQQLERLNNLAIDEREQSYSLLPYQRNWLTGQQLYSQEDYEGAEEELQRALQAAESYVNQYPDAKFIYLDIADMYNRYGDNGMMLSWKIGKDNNQLLLNQSNERLEKSIEIATDFDDSLILGNAYSNIAGLLFVQGQNFQSIDYMKLSETQLAQTGDIESHNSVLGNMGDYYRRWGQLRAAQNAYNRAIENISKVSDIGGQGYIYQKLGSLNLLFLDYDSAIRNTQIAIEFHQSAGRGRSEHESFSQLASIYREQGNFDLARNNRLKALKYLDENGWISSSITAKAELSQDERLLGNISIAYQLSLEVIRQVSDSNVDARIALVPINVNHAQLLFELNQQEESIRLLQDTLLEVENSGAEPTEQILLLSTLMDIYQQQQQTENAINVADKVFGIIESQRAEFDTHRLGPLWSSRTNKIYASHVEHLFENRVSNPEYVERAIVVAERARAVSLRQRRQEMMLNNNGNNQNARSEWIDIVSQLQDSQGVIRNNEQRLAFERRFNAARERYFAAHGLPELRQAPEILTSEQIRGRIPQDSLAIQYVAGNEKLWRFDLGKDYFDVVEIGELTTISKLADNTLLDLKSRNIDSRTNLRVLSKTVLKDLTLDPGINRILVTPASTLESIPFSSLFYQDRYLVDAAALIRVPSISEYLDFLPTTSKLDQLEIAVLADPAFETQTNFGQDQAWSNTLQRLPFSSQEAKDLALHFAEKDRLILTGSDATQQNFFSAQVRNSRILHIATHGYFNEDVPELAGLVMANTNDRDDGFVSLAEIASQKFTSELVVISACDSARGLEVPGEGALSLSRAFLAQGVDSVISTLWPVSDAATAVFMKEFYRGLREEKLDAAESLQEAQRSLRLNPRYRSPFYWSAYVLTSATSKNSNGFQAYTEL